VLSHQIEALERKTKAGLQVLVGQDITWDHKKLSYNSMKNLIKTPNRCLTSISFKV
jgi:hypothetical protein